jgi:hypothetical protein
MSEKSRSRHKAMPGSSRRAASHAQEVGELVGVELFAVELEVAQRPGDVGRLHEAVVQHHAYMSLPSASEAIREATDRGTFSVLTDRKMTRSCSTLLILSSGAKEKGVPFESRNM